MHVLVEYMPGLDRGGVHVAANARDRCQYVLGALSAFDAAMGAGALAPVWESLPKHKRELSAKEIAGMKKCRTAYERRREEGFIAP